MLKSEKRTLVEIISSKYLIPSRQVEQVINEVLAYASERMDRIGTTSYPRPVSTGIVTLDQYISIHPGCTLIYGPPDYGKTSLAKTIAKRMCDAGLNTIYYDAENKLFLHDVSHMTGVVFASSYRESGVKQLVKIGVVDAIVTDTITGVYDQSQFAYVRFVSRHVPFVILVSQMRTDLLAGRLVPACQPSVRGMVHTEICLTNREKVSIEGLDMVRVQFQVVTYEHDRGVERKRGSFIVRNNYIDGVFTAYDVLRSYGAVRFVGSVKYLGSTKIGHIADIDPASDLARLLYDEAASILKQDGLTYV